MALIRGLRGKLPCPICIIKQEDLWDLLNNSPMRTTKEMKEIVDKARSQTLVTCREEILKYAGLRNIDVSISIYNILYIIIIILQNAFWDIERCDIYKALSFDRLHVFHGGLFGRHLWPELKTQVESYGRQTVGFVDSQYIRF